MYAKSGTNVAHADALRRTCYGKCGTDVAYGAASERKLPALPSVTLQPGTPPYAHAAPPIRTRCAHPVPPHVHTLSACPLYCSQSAMLRVCVRACVCVTCVRADDHAAVDFHLRHRLRRPQRPCLLHHGPTPPPLIKHGERERETETETNTLTDTHTRTHAHTHTHTHTD
eukprot:1897143-Rhodomonas_salina.2